MASTTTQDNNTRPVILDRYELIEKIGRGGFSTVYRAYDHRMDRQVAVKAVQQTEELSDRACREARTAAKLSHPNIVTIFELSEDADNVYLVSELVEGKTLAERITSLSLTDRECLEIILQTLEAIGHAHDKGVIHRDIKPENIMLSGGRTPDAKVMDFGIAQLENTQRITRQGDIVGTLCYMSPEQADGAVVDSGTDVYSTALTLYECLTGANPFRAGTAAETVAKIHGGAPPLGQVRPDLPRQLADLIEAAMEPDPDLRLGRAGFAAGIEEVLDQITDEERSTTILRRSDRRRVGIFEDLLGRFGFILPRAFNGVLAGLIVWVAVSRSSLYPDAWHLPLVVAAALLTGLLPRIGIVALAAVALAPIASFSPALGMIIATVAIIYYLVFGLASPQITLVPAVAAGLGYLGLGLAYPAFAGAAGRLKLGLMLALLGGVTLTAAQLFTGTATLDYVGVPNTYNLTAQLSGEYNPVAALRVLASPVQEQPALALQPGLWLLASAPAALLIRRRSLFVDLSGLFLANALLAGGYFSLQYLLPGYQLPVTAFMKTFVLCAIIQLIFLLLSSRAKLQPTSLNERTEET